MQNVVAQASSWKEALFITSSLLAFGVSFVPEGWHVFSEQDKPRHLDMWKPCYLITVDTPVNEVAYPNARML